MRNLEKSRNVIKVGKSVLLIPVAQLAADFGIGYRAVFAFLDALRVPTVAIKKTYYANIYTIERVMYILTSSGEQNIALPGSNPVYASKGRRKKYKFQVTEADLKKMEDPRFIQEWASVRGRLLRTADAKKPKLEGEKKT